jgi:hypothetical protein
MEFETKIIRQISLSDTERYKLLNLHTQYYDNVVPDSFFEDLLNKDWIILITDLLGNPLGFTSIQLVWLEINQTNHFYLYSGDTIVKESIRNSPVLAGAFAHFMLALIRHYPENPIHWFLITKGYRTYRFLPVYFNEYYPVHDKPIPANYQGILDAIAIHKFGDEYNPATQLIHHREEKDHLKPIFAEIPEGKMKDADIRFFHEKNPFFYKGDELACITDIKHSNFKPLVERIIKHIHVDFNWDI